MLLIIYLIYGLAFIGLGGLTILQARTPLSILPRFSMWFLGFFGAIHGTHEFIEMLTLAANPFGEAGETFRMSLGLALLVISFLCLSAFGVSLLVSSRQMIWAAVVPTGMLVVWAAVSSVAGTADNWSQVSSAAGRYLLALPAGILSACGLYKAAKRTSGPWKRAEGHLKLAALAFLVYGFFAGLVPLPAPFLAASWLNTESFMRLTGVPVILVRALAALCIAVVLSEAFVVQIGRIHSDLEAMRREFLSIVAHDLRGPITTITMAVELLQRLADRGQPEPQKLTSLLQHITASTGNLNRLITDLMDASLIEVKRIELHKEAVDFQPFLTQVLERSARITDGHPVKTKLVGKEGDTRIMADPGRLEQVLVNLLSNAAKYSLPGTDILVATEVLANELAVSVSNSGKGIAPEDLPHIFERFRRGRNAAGGTVRGLGLGLHIVKGLVEAQGGQVRADSVPGEMTTFRFTVPRAKSS